MNANIFSKNLWLISLFLFVGFGCSHDKPPAQSDESEQTESTGPTVNYRDYGTQVNVYTHRHYDSDKQLFKLFEDTYQVNVNVVKASADELINRMQEEGPDCPADVLITVDAGRLFRAKMLGIIKPLMSQAIKASIPEQYRDHQNHWVALTKRARVIAYSKERVKPSELSTYAALTDTKWKGRILVRSSDNIYNQSLLASFITHDGEKKAREWAAGIVANMARPPKGNDRDQVKAIAQGIGDVALINTYYYAKLLNSDNPEERKAAEAVALFFPKNSKGKTHVNISGIGLAQHAPNVGNAVRLMEFLVGPQAQKLFAEGNYEYPVLPSVQPSALLNSWGSFVEDDVYFEKLGEHSRKAVMIFDEVGWK